MPSKTSILRRAIYRGACELGVEWIQRSVLRAGDEVEFRLCREPWHPESARGEQYRGVILSTIAEVDDNYAPIYAYFPDISGRGVLIQVEDHAIGVPLWLVRSLQ